MAIEEFGESLLSAQRTRLDEQDRQARRAQKKAKQAQYLQVGGALLGSLAQTNAQKKATSFMRTEPIMAARAKYNAGVAQSISHLENNKLAQAHQQGVVGYLREKYIPLLQDQINRNINEKDYTKDGYDKYIYDKATELAQANESKFNEATAAAMRVGKDSTAFDNFIKLNDGIADTPIGAVAQGITGLFRGKSQQALRADAANNILSSRYIQDVDALKAARAALTQGFPALEAAQIGQSIEKYKMSDDDYDEVSRKYDTITKYINDKKYTITGTRVLKKNSWKQEREDFIPDEEFKDLAGMSAAPKVTTKVVSDMGIDYNVTTTQAMDIFDNPIGEPVITKRVIGTNLEGTAGIDARQVSEVNSLIRRRADSFQTAVSDEPFDGISEAYAKYILGDGSITNKDTLPDDIFNARAARMIAQGAAITAATKANNYKDNSKNLGVTISQHVFFNDMQRTADSSFLPRLPDSFDTSKSLMVAGANHSPLEILEAIGSIRKSKHATIDGRYMATLLTNDFVKDQLNALQSDPETLGKYIKTFNAYQDDPAYNHLFRKEVNVNGQRVSIYDMLLLTQQASQ